MPIVLENLETENTQNSLTPPKLIATDAYNRRQ